MRQRWNVSDIVVFLEHKADKLLIFHACKVISSLGIVLHAIGQQSFLFITLTGSLVHAQVLLSWASFIFLRASRFLFGELFMCMLMHTQNPHQVNYRQCLTLIFMSNFTSKTHEIRLQCTSVNIEKKIKVYVKIPSWEEQLEKCNACKLLKSMFSCQECVIYSFLFFCPVQCS